MRSLGSTSSNLSDYSVRQEGGKECRQPLSSRAWRRKRLRYSGRIWWVCLFFGLLAVSAEASADWKVYDDKVYNELDSVNKKLDQIYKQSHAEGNAFDVDEHKTINIQDDDELKIEKRSDASDVQGLRCKVESKNAINQKQNEICNKLVAKEVALNNYLLEMLELAKQRQEQLKAIVQERKDIKSGSTSEYGALESNSNKLLALQAQIQIDQMNVKLTMDSYGRYFSDQNSQLADLARDLQRGKGDSLVGGALRSAILAAALAGAHLYQTNAQE